MIVWHVDTSSGPRFEWARGEEHLRQQVIDYNNTVLNAGEPDDQLPEDATLEEAIEKIEEMENFSREGVWNGHVFADRERDTILAALRVYGDWLSNRPTDRGMVNDIALNGGKHDRLMGPKEIDALCERINA